MATTTTVPSKGTQIGYAILGLTIFLFYVGLFVGAIFGLAYGVFMLATAPTYGAALITVLSAVAILWVQFSVLRRR